MSETPRTYHCCVLKLAGIGLLIEGPSGSGKTSLMMGLLERARSEGIKAAFVCDDQAILSIKDGLLHASAPESIAGMAELSGFGIVRMPHIPATPINHVFRLVPDESLDRMPEPAQTELLGLQLPLADLPARHEARAVRIIFASLQLL